MVKGKNSVGLFIHSYEEKSREKTGKIMKNIDAKKR